MGDAHQGRLGAAAGIAFVVLVVLSLIFFGDPPAFNDTPEQVADYLNENRGEIQLGTALTLVGAVAFFLFLATLVRGLRIAEERGPGRLAAVAFAGGIVTMAFVLLGWGLLWAASARTALGAGDLDPVLMQAFLDASNFSIMIAIAVGFTTLVGASSAVAHATGALPRPLGAFGALVALVSIVAAVGASFKETGAFSAADGALPFIALIGFLIWVFWTSIVLLRQSEDSTEPAAAQT